MQTTTRNNYNLYKVILIIGLSGLYPHTFAQSSYSLYGITTDIANSNIQDVAVCLRSPIDSSYVSSIQSDANGKFKLHCSSGEYLLQATHMAFKPHFSRIIIDKDTELQIKLEDDVHVLDEVLIKGATPIIKNHNGNLLVDVLRLAQENESIGNLLNKLPGVNNNKGDGITLNGLPVTIYIDGMKQTLNSTAVQNLLASMPATSIENIELISIPDGSFDASSNAVIKIKSRQKGSDGYYIKVATAGTLYKDQLSGGADLFYMLKKRNITFNLSAEYSNDYDLVTSTDSTNYLSERYLVTNNFMDGRTDMFRINSNLNIYLPKNNTLKFNLFAYDDFGRKNGNWNTIRPTIEKEYNKAHYKSNDDLWSGNMQFETSDSLPVRLNVFYGIVYGGLRSDNEYEQLSGDSYQEYLTSRLRMTGHQQLANIKLDMDLGSKSLLSIGANGSFGKLKDNASYRPTNTDHIDVPSTLFRADENIIGFFGTFNHRLTDELNMRFSLRGEYTDYELDLQTNDSKQTDRYWNVFPYYSVSYSGKNYSTILGFVSGITRPNYEWMLPGVRYSNDYSYTQGNPYLKPTRNYSVAWNNTFFQYAYLNLRYNIYKKIQGTALINRENDVTEYTYLNYADLQQFSTYLTLPFSFWDGNLLGQVTGNVSYSHYNKIAESYEIAATRKKHYVNYSLKAYVQYQYDRFGINGLFNFYPETSNLQMDMEKRWELNLGVTYDLLSKRTMTVSLDANDLFDTMKSKHHYYIGNVYKYATSKINNRYFTLSISYKFDSGAKVMNKYVPNETNDVGRFTK